MAKQNPIIAAYNNGKKEGIRETREQVLGYLEDKYMSPNVERKTPIADGILEIARELSEMMKA